MMSLRIDSICAGRGWMKDNITSVVSEAACGKSGAVRINRQSNIAYMRNCMATCKHEHMDTGFIIFLQLHINFTVNGSWLIVIRLALQLTNN
jgi:hypothetical protein